MERMIEMKWKTSDANMLKHIILNRALIIHILYDLVMESKVKKIFHTKNDFKPAKIDPIQDI